MTDREKLSVINAEIERRIDEAEEHNRHSTADELDNILCFINSLPEEPVSKVWHDSNNEQPKDQRTVVILNPEEKSGEVLQRCLCVYENRIWAYLEDILPT